MKFQNQRTLRARFLKGWKILMFPLLFFNICEIIITYLTWENPTEPNGCYFDAVSKEQNSKSNTGSVEDGGSVPLEDLLLSPNLPPPGKSIFLIETSCPCSDAQFDLLALTPRQACAVESAALHNPSLKVFVLFACQTSRYQWDPITDAILSYRNVELRHVNLWRLSEGTPVQDWVKKQDLFQSRYLMNNISNLLRLLSLYRFGGIYLDMDVVVLRSFEFEPLNFVGAETEKYISNGVLGLQPGGFGHKLAELFLREFQKNYNGDIWGHNGPRNIFITMTNVCDTSDVTLMQEDSSRCHGMKVFPVSAFYEIPGRHWSHFFEPKLANQTLERLRISYLTHVWNRMSSRRSLRVDSKSAYILLAEKHCPKVLATTRDRFD